jgi:hypothetical protein
LDTLIGKAKIMFGINKVFRAKKGFSPYGSSGLGRPYRQYLPHRIFPEGKNILSCKGQIISVFPPYKPPFTVLFNSISGGYQAIAA